MHFESNAWFLNKYVLKKANLFYFQNLWLLQFILNCIPTLTYFNFSIDSVFVYLHCFYKEKIISFNLYMNKKYEENRNSLWKVFIKNRFPSKKFLVHLSHLIYLRESQRNKSEGVQLATLLTIKLPQILFLTIFNRVVEYLFWRPKLSGFFCFLWFFIEYVLIHSVHFTKKV